MNYIQFLPEILQYTFYRTYLSRHHKLSFCASGFNNNNSLFSLFLHVRTSSKDQPCITFWTFLPDSRQLLIFFKSLTASYLQKDSHERMLQIPPTFNSFNFLVWHLFLTVFSFSYLSLQKALGFSHIFQGQSLSYSHIVQSENCIST